MVFDSGRDKDRTMMGNTPEQAAEVLSAAGADVLGANCGQGIAGFPLLCRRFRAATDRPLWFKPNAGLPQWVEGRATYTTTPEEFVQSVPALVQKAARISSAAVAAATRLHPRHHPLSARMNARRRSRFAICPDPPGK